MSRFQVSMRWALNLLQKVLRAAEALQFARQQRLWKPHSRSRFSMSYIENLPSVRRYQQELQLFRNSEKYDPMKFYLERLNGIKEKMAWAVIRNKALRLPRRRPGVLRLYAGLRREWQVEDFCQRLRKCVAKAQLALQVARDTAACRVVRNTRVFLCTIPSSYQVGNRLALTDIFVD